MLVFNQLSFCQGCKTTLGEGIHLLLEQAAERCGNLVDSASIRASRARMVAAIEAARASAAGAGSPDTSGNAVRHIRRGYLCRSAFGVM
jgi:hypothetical protein